MKKINKIIKEIDFTVFYFMILKTFATTISVMPFLKLVDFSMDGVLLWSTSISITLALVLYNRHGEIIFTINKNSPNLVSNALIIQTYFLLLIAILEFICFILMAKFGCDFLWILIFLFSIVIWLQELSWRLEIPKAIEFFILIVSATFVTIGFNWLLNYFNKWAKESFVLAKDSQVLVMVIFLAAIYMLCVKLISNVKRNYRDYIVYIDHKDAEIIKSSLPGDYTEIKIDLLTLHLNNEFKIEKCFWDNAEYTIDEKNQSILLEYKFPFVEKEKFEDITTICIKLKCNKWIKPSKYFITYEN